MSDTLAQGVITRFNTADSYKQRFSPLYQQVSNLMGNGHNFSWNNSAMTTMGVDQTTKYFDSTPINYRDIMCAMIIGFGANPMTKWFNLGLMDKDEQPEDITVRWLERERDFILERLQLDGGYQVLQNINPGFVDYGAGPFFVDERPVSGKKEGFQGYRFMSVPLQNIWFVDDGYGRVNGCWQREWMTGYEAVQFFGGDGDRVPDPVRKAAASLDQYTRFGFINEVMPEGDKWRSVWVCFDTTETVRVATYEEFPYIVPRDDVFPGEIYPRGRSVKQLATIKEQNGLSRDLGYASGYRTRPPLLIQERTKIDYKSMTPAGLLRYDGEKPEALSLGGDLSFWEAKYQLNDACLRRGYFVDQLELAEDRLQDMKATVAIEKIKRSRIVLAPLFVNLEYQLYKPLISRMVRLHVKGMTKEERDEIPPQILERGGELDVEVVCPMAKAQQEVDLQAMTNGIGYILNMTAVFPELRDILDPDKIAENVAKLTNTPLSNFRPPEQVQQIRTVKQRIQMQQMQLQAMAQAAPAVKDIADAQAVQAGAAQ